MSVYITSLVGINRRRHVESCNRQVGWIRTSILLWWRHMVLVCDHSRFKSYSNSEIPDPVWNSLNPLQCTSIKCVLLTCYTHLRVCKCCVTYILNLFTNGQTLFSEDLRHYLNIPEPKSIGDDQPWRDILFTACSFVVGISTTGSPRKSLQIIWYAWSYAWKFYNVQLSWWVSQVL